ncbi:alcohol dehydrogenase [Penicillium angulare]|uniref:Alcohol dehydrogenase n=1 Tax=Penicillium angulare TaxID=116970 RepID=A0A9W9GD15_9EURO|nr:alcohol dehydrogenase [Penicillium angulare]
MLAVRFHGKGDIRVDKVEEPKCKKGEIKMKPAFVGICGSDLHEYTSGPVLVPKSNHPITGESSPVTMGHEFSGTIEEVGEGVNHLRPGQRAVVRPTIFDKECAACTQGSQHCCKNIGFIGLSGYGGGMAEHIVAPAGHYYPLPDSIALEHASLIEPLAVAWHAVDRSPFKANDNTLVLGAGPIGIGTVQVLSLRGAKNIIVVELLPNRKELAKQYGATHVLDPREVDIPTAVRGLTDQNGVELVFDTAGVEVALNGVIEATRVQGTIVNIAVWEARPAIDVNDLMYREINYMGATLYDENSFQQVINALHYGQLKPHGMISTKLKLQDAVDKGFKQLLEARDSYCKILVDPQWT